MATDTDRYKGFQIHPRPYRLQDTGRWTVDLEIHRKGQRQSFSLSERYRDESEAHTRATSVARRIIDGRLPGWSVDHLRAAEGPAGFTYSCKEYLMRQLTIIGIVVLALGAVALVRGSGFTTREDQFSVGDVTVTATERHKFPAWAGGAIVLVGVALIVAGIRQRT